MPLNSLYKVIKFLKLFLRKEKIRKNCTGICHRFDTIEKFPSFLLLCISNSHPSQFLMTFNFLLQKGLLSATFCSDFSMSSATVTSNYRNQEKNLKHKSWKIAKSFPLEKFHSISSFYSIGLCRFFQYFYVIIAGFKYVK